MERIKRYLLPRALRKFVQLEEAGGLVMMLFAALAIIAANSSASGWYEGFVNYPISIGAWGYAFTDYLSVWVKDGLMVLFFLVIGMELKRELKEGFLSKRDQALLPFIAAVDGMLVPAAIFLAITIKLPAAAHGWAIPSATDIAFALAILSVFGKNVPPSVKVFLLAIAIFDDLGAIIIIAGFYNTGFDLYPFLLSMAGVFALFALNYYNYKNIPVYLFVGLIILINFHYCGVHTTLAGVLVGLAIPLKLPDSKISPLNSLLKKLHPWVSFFVLPLFAFIAAGVDLAGFNLQMFMHPVPLGIALGLFLGKQIGIFGIAFLLVKLKLVSMPEGARWIHIYGASVLAGIGFTMSLFIGMLAFPEEAARVYIKVGVIAGSLLSIIWGAIILKLAK